MSREAAFQAMAVELGYDFNGEIKIGGNYSPFVQHGSEVYVSGQIPRVGNEVVVTGRVGEEVSLERAQLAAKVSAMRALALLRQALVADGASEVLFRVLGDAGVHSRTSVGVYQLPKNAAVEIDLIAAAE